MKSVKSYTKSNHIDILTRKLSRLVLAPGDSLLFEMSEYSKCYLVLALWDEGYSIPLIGPVFGLKPTSR